MFLTESYIYPILYFVNNDEANPTGALIVLHSEGRLLSLTLKIRLGWKWMRATSALAYYTMVRITEEIFYRIGPCSGCY